MATMGFYGMTDTVEVMDQFRGTDEITGMLSGLIEECLHKDGKSRPSARIIRDRFRTLGHQV